MAGGTSAMNAGGMSTTPSTPTGGTPAAMGGVVAATAGGQPASTGGAATPAPTGGTPSAGGTPEAGGASAAGGSAAANAGGTVAARDCLDRDVITSCETEDDVADCFDNTGQCSQSDESCDANADCAGGICYSDDVCNGLQADCVERKGLPAAANCLRQFVTCLQDGSRNELECGQESSNCLLALPECD